MRVPRTLLPLLAVLMLLGVSVPVEGGEEKSSLEYAKLGKKLLGVIQCQHYSAFLKNEKESTRFGKLGIKVGRDFITARNAGKINKKDWNANVPTIFGLMKGPSVDFVLGEIWQYIGNNVSEKLQDELGADGCEECKWDKKLRSLRIAKKYDESNCELIK
jgi:hypothetical protein